MKVSKQNALKLLAGQKIKLLREVRRGVDLNPRVDKNGMCYLTKPQIYRVLEVRKGKGFFGNLYKKVKDFGSKVVDVIKSHIEPAFLKSFQVASNALRSTVPGARKLKLGELHPTGIKDGKVIPYAFLGPGTDYEHESHWAPVNALDALAKTHDAAYYAARNLSPDQKALAIQRADEEFIHELNKHSEKYKDLPFYSLAKQGIESKSGLEKLVSLIKGHPKILFGGKF